MGDCTTLTRRAIEAELDMRLEPQVKRSTLRAKVEAFIGWAGAPQWQTVTYDPAAVRRLRDFPLGRTVVRETTEGEILDAWRVTLERPRWYSLVGSPSGGITRYHDRANSGNMGGAATRWPAHVRAVTPEDKQRLGLRVAVEAAVVALDVALMMKTEVSGG